MPLNDQRLFKILILIVAILIYPFVELKVLDVLSFNAGNTYFTINWLYLHMFRLKSNQILSIPASNYKENIS